MKKLENPINGSFGRTKKFLIIDDKSNDIEIVDNNQNLQAAQGAGIQSAQNLVKAGAEVVITLNCGPKAFKVLSGSGVSVFIGIKASIQENLEAFFKDELKEMKEANMESHWV